MILIFLTGNLDQAGVLASPGSAAPALLSVLAGLLSVAETLTSGTRPFLVGGPVLRLVGWSFQQLPWPVPVTCQWPVPKL